MIQRLLYQMISTGIDIITADPTRLDTILRGYDLSSAELEQVRDVWTAKPPHVKHHYARKDDDFPLYAIVLGNEAEAETYLGDDAGTWKGRSGSTPTRSSVTPSTPSIRFTTTRHSKR